MSKGSVIIDGSIYKHMVRGSAWALLMRWGIRAIGLISVMILARLLTPSDFGIVAMGALMIGLLSVFANFTIGAFVIREQSITPEVCNTAWTFSLLQGFIIALALAACAPIAVHYFNEPRILPVIYVLAVSAAIEGAQNIGMTLVRKELDFAKDFRFQIYTRLVRFLATVTLAIWLRNYWALVFGVVAGRCASVVLSYCMHPYRPRLSFAKARQLFSFGLSMMVSNVAGYFNAKIDVLVIGGIANTAFLGVYHVASELSKMATSGIVVPIGRGLFPSYSKIAHSPRQLEEAYLQSLSAIAVLCFATGVGLSAIAEDAVMVILGEKWTAAVPILQWLALYALFDSIVLALMGHILIVTGREWLVATLQWVRLAIFAPAVVGAAVMWGVERIPVAAAIVAAGLIPLVAYTIARTLSIGPSRIAGVLWRPAISALVMAGALQTVHLDNVLPVVSLAVSVVIGALVYSVMLFALWLIAGRPDGTESVVLSTVRDRLRPASSS